MKKIISAVLASVMLTGTAAGAIEIQEDWVNLSAWAYNDVSNFTNEGLLPESFKGINDYRVPITREQFAELVYPIYASVRVLEDYYQYFDDCDNKAAAALHHFGIIQGVKDDYEGNLFKPDKTITREDAAVIAVRTSGFLRQYISEDSGGLIEPTKKAVFTDEADISEYALLSVYQLSELDIVSSMGDGSFNPKGEVTIEQAISMLYKLYQYMPAASKADGANINAKEETLLKSFDNGCTETKLGNRLYIKRGDTTLMSFETDMYFRLICADYNGKTYILAYNFNKRTNVFDAETKKQLFTIPCYTIKVSDGYIHTRSADRGMYLCGLYDFDGNEVLPNEYSEYEIEQLIADNLQFPDAEDTEADGIVYYTDEENGNMYSVDTNGENNRLICDKNCSDIVFIDGWLYFRAPDEDYILYAMKPDGSALQRVSQYASYMIRDVSYTFNSADGWVYYLDDDYTYSQRTLNELTGKEEFHDVMRYTLWRCKPGENGEITKEQIYDKPLGMLDNNGSPTIYDGKVYFLDYTQLDKEDGSYFYCFDGEKVIQLTDERFTRFDFWDDSGNVYFELYYSGKRDSTRYNYSINPDGTRHRDENTFSPYHPDEEPNTDPELLREEISDDSYKIYRNYQEITTSFVDSDGNRTILKEGGFIDIYRYKNILYYRRYAPYNDASEIGLFMYDMDTKTETRITDNISSFLLSPLNDKFLSDGSSLSYDDQVGNIYQIKLGSAEAVQIYPNSGAQKLGKTYVIDIDAQNRLIKIDTNGGRVQLSQNRVGYWNYVENSASTGDYCY